MTDAEQREAARQFYQKWAGKGKEDEDDRSYWFDILQNLFGIPDVTNHIDFQKKVIVDGKTKRIDAYLPETKVLIEQKSLGVALDQKIKQSGGIELTPYEQAKRYNDNLPFSDKARWIVTSNFAEIWVYDMDTKVPEPQVIKIENLQNECYRLSFLIKEKVSSISAEMQISIQAGEIVGLLYDAFYKQYGVDDISDENERIRTLESLNILCVRLVFCLYAEDAGLFGAHGMFHDYLERYEPKDMRRALLELFEVLNTPDGANGTTNKRARYLEEELAVFPYVNGGLFFGNYEIPPFTDEIRTLLLEKACDFDWHEISPTIFGAVFESTLNPETRRAGGMHYTSIENIHKVIDPLFLNDLQAELDEIKEISVVRTQKTRLEAYQDKLASLTFLDPACGSGNFLTETYLSLRRLENEVLAMKIAADKKEVDGQILFGFENVSPIKVSIQQFYGIEINDFAVTVAMTALFIAESQMLKETEAVVRMNIDYLPLKSYVNIVEGNALRIDWSDVVPKERLNFIMGNPPFSGARLMSERQKQDVLDVFGKDWKNAGNLDYVSCWYKKSADYMKDTMIRAALVSTNSLTQGESVADLWERLFADGMVFDFAYRTFRWDSEAKSKAHVHCVIIGFGMSTQGKSKIIYTTERKTLSSDASQDATEVAAEIITSTPAENINGYLVNAENVFVRSRSKPLCDVPEIGIGNKPIDGGFFLFKKEEMEEFICKEPASKPYFHPWYGSDEFINRRPRYCLYLRNCSPEQLRKMPECMKRIEAVRAYRASSTSAATRKIAEEPTRFHVTNIPDSTYLLIPEVSSERRRYIPMGYMTPDAFSSNLVRIMHNATLYHFGILESNVHMAWVRQVCGRLKSDYRYSKDIVYNNFPWPDDGSGSVSEDVKIKIEQTAQGILDARALYPNASFADLYDPRTMPPELLKAHRDNDRAVMQAYGFNIKEMSEADCVAALMKLYQEKVSKIQF